LNKRAAVQSPQPTRFEVQDEVSDDGMRLMRRIREAQEDDGA
jgi:hypothetical protein